MEYKEFERIMSKKRMERYLTACNGDTRKAMTLYRYNLHLSRLQEFYQFDGHLNLQFQNRIFPIGIYHQYLVLYH